MTSGLDALDDFLRAKRDAMVTQHCRELLASGLDVHGEEFRRAALDYAGRVEASRARAFAKASEIITETADAQCAVKH